MHQSYKIVIISLFCLTCGVFIGYRFPKSTDSSFQETHNQTSTKRFKYISPLLVCGNPASNSLGNLKKQVHQVIDKQTQVSHVSVYFRDLNNGPWFGINENELFSPASLVKVPLAIALYKQSEADPNLLSQTLINDQIDSNEEQNIKPDQTIVPNQEYTIDNLIENMIVYSDNNAYEILSDFVDQNILIQTYTDLGIDISKAINNPAGDILSVRNYASFFRILFNSSYLNQQMSNKLLSLLTQVTYKKALVAGIGSQVEVAHKFGERRFLGSNELQLHDCGIVYKPNKPYLICIMTRGSNFDHLNQAIKLISSTIFQYWQKI